VSELRAVPVTTYAKKRGWNVSHVAASGDCLEENEILAHFPDIGLGLDKPDFLFCLSGEPAVVVEAKNDAGKLEVALSEAVQYAEQINRTGRYRVDVAVGAAGEQDAGFTVEVRYLADGAWVPLTALGFELTSFPAKRECELALAADDGTTSVTVPASQEFIDAAVELSAILRGAKVEAPLRPKVIGAIVMAMYGGQVDVTPALALGSVNDLAGSVIAEAVDIPDAKKKQLGEALLLSGADFDRLAPSIGRVVSILRRLNVRAVVHTDTDFLGMFYEAFLRYGYDNNALGIVFTPRHITRFCVSLTTPTIADRIIDVASGTGGFLVAAFDKMLEQASRRGPEAIAKVKASLTGFDTNPTVWALAMVNMFLRGDGKSNLELGSCLSKDNRACVRRSFTRAYLNPPFSQDGEPERDFLDAAMDALEPGGLLAAVVYAGIFADDDHKAWRREFLRRHTLVGMISLPEDLFYPTAAPTSVVVARAHSPHKPTSNAIMARVWNDGFEKLKNRRIERPGSQLPVIHDVFSRVSRGDTPDSPLATLVAGQSLAEGAEWSPQQWLPQPDPEEGELESLQADVVLQVFRAVAHYPALSDEALHDFGDAWDALPPLSCGTKGELTDFFDVKSGKSTGERNYADGATAYVSSGDATNSIIRLVTPLPGEVFESGGLTVTAFGMCALQPWPFLARGNGGSAVRVLVPKYNMSLRELVWFAAQVNLQRWRFFYARMSIKSRLQRLVVESPPQSLPDNEYTIAARLAEFRASLDALSAL